MKWSPFRSTGLLPLVYPSREPTRTLILSDTPDITPVYVFLLQQPSVGAGRWQSRARSAPGKPLQNRKALLLHDFQTRDRLLQLCHGRFGDFAAFDLQPREAGDVADPGESGVVHGDVVKIGVFELLEVAEKAKAFPIALGGGEFQDTQVGETLEGLQILIRDGSEGAFACSVWSPIFFHCASRLVAKALSNLTLSLAAHFSTNPRAFLMTAASSAVAAVR